MRNVILSLSLLVILIFERSAGHLAGIDDVATSASEEAEESLYPASGLMVNLEAPIGRTILFSTEDHDDENNTEPHNREIPHLVLNRNGVLTPGYERTLVVTVPNLAVPPTGMYVQLTIETQHGDPDLGGGNEHVMQVWKETNFVPYLALTQQGVSINFTITFDRFTKLQDRIILTPTDYYRYRVVAFDPEGDVLLETSEDYAFLMENQWRVPLPGVNEISPNAAPDELIVYFYDMIPFQAHSIDPLTQILRQEVERYIQTELVPAMVEAFRVQTDIWGFPWYSEWFNYRQDENPKTLSVALGEYKVWFHGKAPSLGHSMISIRVDGSVGEYESFTDGIMSVFHHELFHNHQRNISLHFGSQGSLAGMDEAWMVFSEGTAVLASSVGQPKVQFEQTNGARSYLKRANAFIGSEGTISGGLNKSYERIPYQTAVYWRFLYEKCGGLKDGRENPAEGMKVIRLALETLYKGEIVNINSSTDVPGALPRIMDHALANTPSCPFRNYEESLKNFARSIYMLRLENGRCTGTRRSHQCAFYDPSGLYPTPPVEGTVLLVETEISVNGNIPASFGMDFMEIMTGASRDARSVTIIFERASGSLSDFNIEVMVIKNPESDVENSKGFFEATSFKTTNGQTMINVNEINEFDYLALIITRLDSHERSEPLGNYRIHFLLE